jgi:hypothetical protein
LVAECIPSYAHIETSETGLAWNAIDDFIGKHYETGAGSKCWQARVQGILERIEEVVSDSKLLHDG